MEQKTTSSSFHLTAVIDGTTIIGYLRVEHAPLVQRYIKDTKKCIPDFETMAESERPVALPVLRESSTGDILIPTRVTFSYNGKPLTFGEDNLCNTEGFTGVFKYEPTYQTSIGGQSYNIPAVRVMKNLVPISGYDNDRLSVSGEVERGGNTFEFKEYSKEVIIQETTGGEYDVQLVSDQDFVFNQKTDRVTAKAIIRLNGEQISDIAKYTFKWFTMKGGHDQAKGTAQTQDFTLDDVDFETVIRAEVYSEAVKVGTGWARLHDFTDPLQVRCDITGISGTQIRKGQTAEVKPVLIDAKTGNVSDVAVSNWTVHTVDNKGADFTLHGKDGAEFTITNEEKIQVNYEDMVRAGMGLFGYVSTTF